MPRIAPLLALLFVPTASAQPPGASFAPQRETRAVTLDDHFPFTAPKGLEAWTERKERLRRQVLVAAGLFPMPEKTPLEPRIHGRVERDGYSVENLAIEALPGFFVTGNLYRPEGEGPFAGVLCPHGHWTNGRFSEVSEDDVRAQIARGEEAHLANGRYHLQARCAQLARMGCVVFHYDMIGYADSTQLDHRDSLGSVQDELHSLSHFGLQTWSSIRALDFLEALEDVDPERLGVTGASGGGTQTFILCAIDDRPKVALPAVMVSTGMQGGCECENASHLRVGTGNVELAALAAPMAYALTGANDWTINILNDGLPRLKEIWQLYGAREKVAAWCYPQFEHNYNLVSRLRMYAWFDEHLELGYTRPIVERPIEPIEPAELSVFDADHPRPEAAIDVETLRVRWVAESERRANGLARGDVHPDRWREVTRHALEVLLHTSLPSRGELGVEGLGMALQDGGSMTSLGFEGKHATALFIKPAVWNGVVVVREAARQSFDARTLLSGVPSGAATLIVETLLSGPDTRPLPVDGGRHGRFSGYTHGYNRTLLAHRVHDLLLAIAYMRDHGARSIRLHGEGDAGPRMLLAAALAGDAVDRVVAEWAWDFTSAEGADDARFLPGALRFGGMSAFASLVAPTELLILGRSELPASVQLMYAAAGKPQAARAVRHVNPLMLAAWLQSK